MAAEDRRGGVPYSTDLVNLDSTDTDNAPDFVADYAKPNTSSLVNDAN